jgi:hypothetical protein
MSEMKVILGPDPGISVDGRVRPGHKVSGRP